MQPTISIVVPLYNEESVFPTLVGRLNALTTSPGVTLEFVLVDDGSRDATSSLMRDLAEKDSRYTCIFLSRNYGHQAAVSAGMANVSASEAVMIIDGDLQDPPELVNDFFSKIREGYDVVYGIRKKRKENLFKRFAYWFFYRLLRTLSEVNIPLDSGDFCMMTRKVNDVITSMPEQSRFLRGMRTWVGFRQYGFEYEREKRASGDPKYTLKALFNLAYDGIYNFSYVPMRVITRLGFFSIVVSLGYLAYVLIKRFMGYEIPSGFTALIFAIVLFSGVQLICLGIIGEYVGRIYRQVKNRPMFLIRNKISGGKEQNG
ncbi:MAG: glycosyltransferase family 2 protein [Cyclobacteriaceae bacterium]|nr:glycosyltransferase family 2 protein [Cyclobacteriaceae bacterium]